jgi:hypothetical protein
MQIEFPKLNFMKSEHAKLYDCEMNSAKIQKVARNVMEMLKAPKLVQRLSKKLVSAIKA